MIAPRRGVLPSSPPKTKNPLKGPVSTQRFLRVLRLHRDPNRSADAEDAAPTVPSRRGGLRGDAAPGIAAGGIAGLGGGGQAWRRSRQRGNGWQLKPSWTVGEKVQPWGSCDVDDTLTFIDL